MAETSEDAGPAPEGAPGPEARRGPAGPAADHAPPGDASPPRDQPGAQGPAAPGRDTRYDDAADQVSDASSAADRADFRAVIDELRGDFVAGDKISITVAGHRGVTVRAYRISDETLAHPHVPASGLAGIEDAVRHSRIVAVRGPEGSGRRAALLHALAGGSREIAVVRLDPRTDLRTLAPEHFRDAHAMILEDLTEDHLDQLDDFELDRLRNELTNRWLGLTVAAGRGLPTALTSVVVDIGEPPSADEVFTCHLEAAQPSGDRRTALLADPAVRDQLARAMGPPSRLGRAAELAAFLATYDGPVEEVADRLQAWITLGADTERLRWFQALPSLRAHCAALALAVFEGLDRETVTALGDQLHEQIAPTPENQKPDEVGNPFAAGSGVPPGMLRAAATREAVSFVEGDVTLSVLRYKDLAYRRWVLQHVWDEVDPVRPAVVIWLRELGDHPDRWVRLRAAGAAGVLADRAFTTVHKAIIADWAAGPGIRARRSAAHALSVPAANPVLAPTVNRMLEGWISGKDPSWRATAALLVGETADPATVTGCLEQLAELADHDDPDVAVAVATSLTDMLTTSGGALAGHVLREVTMWMNQRAWRGRRSTGHLAFLSFTSVVGDPAVPRRRDDPDRAVPTLLLGAQASEEFARQVGRALHDGLNDRLSRRLGRSLARWAEHVEKRPEYMPVLAWLLRAAATDGRTATAVARAVRSWTPDAAPQTAATVLASLRGMVPDG